MSQNLTEEEILRNLEAKQKENEKKNDAKDSKEPDNKHVDPSKFKAKTKKLRCLRAIDDCETVMNGSLLNFRRNERVSEPFLVEHLLENNKENFVIDDGAVFHKCPNCLTVFSPQLEN